MRSPLDDFIPSPDIRERFHVTVRAPAPLVMEVARGFDLQSILLIRAIFRLREVVMRAHAPVRKPRGLVEEMLAIGWGVLADEPGRLIVCGAVCRPWLADVGFTPIPSREFATYQEPGWVKIAWTLETEETGSTMTRFAHETRAVATDSETRRRFLAYWRWARFGIIPIRLLLLPAVRRAAERRWMTESRPSA